MSPDEWGRSMAKHERRIAQIFGATVGCLFTVALILNALAF
jgi:hypothetical protein